MSQNYMDSNSRHVYSTRCDQALVVLKEVIDQLTVWGETYSETFFTVPLAVAANLHRRVVEIKREIWNEERDYYELRDMQDAMRKVQTNFFNVMANIAKEQFFRDGFTADNILNTYLFWERINIYYLDGRLSDLQSIEYDFLRDPPLLRVLAVKDLYLIGEPDMRMDDYWNHVEFPVYDDHHELVLLDCEKNDHQVTHRSVSAPATEEEDEEYVKMEDGGWTEFEERERHLIVAPDMERPRNPYSRRF